MQLAEWMKKNNISQTELARRIDVFPNQINNVIRGRHKPTLKLANKIKNETNGEVTLDDIFSISPPASLKERIENMIYTDREIQDIIKQKVAEAIDKSLKREVFIQEMDLSSQKNNN